MRDRTGKNSWLPLLFFFFFYIHAPANIFVEHLKWWEEEKVPWHLLFGKSFAVFFFFSCLLVEITPCLLSPILYIYFSFFFFIGLHVFDQWCSSLFNCLLFLWLNVCVLFMLVEAAASTYQVSSPVMCVRACSCVFLPLASSTLFLQLCLEIPRVAVFRQSFFELFNAILTGLAFLPFYLPRVSSHLLLLVFVCVRVFLFLSFSFLFLLVPLLE